MPPSPWHCRCRPFLLEPPQRSSTHLLHRRAVVLPPPPSTIAASSAAPDPPTPTTRYSQALIPGSHIHPCHYCAAQSKEWSEGGSPAAALPAATCTPVPCSDGSEVGKWVAAARVYLGRRKRRGRGGGGSTSSLISLDLIDKSVAGCTDMLFFLHDQS